MSMHYFMTTVVKIRVLAGGFFHAARPVMLLSG
jgi:hypothetical protein